MAIVGIDLGTTNSLVAVWQDSEARIIDNVLGSRLTPSVVGLDDNGDVLVGQAAKERLVTHPDLTVASFKRFMGSDRVTKLGHQRFRPEELSAFVLRSLKSDAEAFLGKPVEEAVISVPAYFNDTQRKATRLAGQLAGLKVERLINEPTAAAMAYGLHESSESTFLVFDLGGGTFDVSVLELFEGVMEVHASAGDNHLGGDDFTSLLVDWFLKESDISSEAFTSGQDSALRKMAELAKQELSRSDQTTLRFRFEGREVEKTLNRREMEVFSKPLLHRLRQPVERAMRDAKMSASSIDAVVLVGGATRMPLVRSVAAKLFGKFPMTQVQPDEAVALGTAIQAGLKSRDAALSETVLTDVSPYSLGVAVAVTDERGEIVGREFSPILERNTVVPASRVNTYSPVRDEQKAVLLSVYQGESRRLENNVRIGELSVPVPIGDRAHRGIDVRFTYDINGLLEVEATVANGTQKRLVIEGSPGAMTEQEIEKRLRALESIKIHPREALENRTLLARGERLYEESLGTVRDHISREMARFEAVLARQDPREVIKARNELIRELDRIEGNVW